ncbi:MAG: hypothetical protein IJ461_03355, partial [Clostridia bacterium]|nr:hypothetical protein [Clostridia bacterium]
MKHWKLLSLLLCLALVLGLTGSALAADVPIKATGSVSPDSMSDPREVTVSIKITNVDNEDLPGSLSLLDPAGYAVTTFGDGGSSRLAKGSTITWSGAWQVTEKQLDAGKIRYQVKYPIYNKDADTIQMKNYYVDLKITKTEAEPALSVKRTISPTMAKKGQTVNVIYELENTGRVDIRDIKVKENKNISSKTQSVENLKVGEKAQVSFEVEMKSKDLTSQGTVTFKGATTSKTYTEKVDKATVRYGESKITAQLTASEKVVNLGEVVKLELILANAGNIDYTNVKVTDPVLGEVFTNQDLPADSTKVLTKEVTLQESANFDFTISAADSTGGEEIIKPAAVAVQAIDPNKKVAITLNAVADRAEIHEEPSVVRFTVTATNTSEVDAENVVITSGESTLYTFDYLRAGQSKHFVRDVSASMAGKFQFTASTKDLLGNTVTFLSNVVPITYAAPTPVPTEAPVRTPPPLVLEEIPTEAGLPEAVDTVQRVAYTLCFVFGGLLVAVLLLLLVAAIRRGVAKSASKKAMDHLERGTRRDYTNEPNEAEGDERHSFPSEDEEDLFGIDLPESSDEEAEPEEVTQELTEEPAPAADEEPVIPAAEEEPQPQENAAIMPGSDGSYRLSRQASQPIAAASAREFNRRRASR